MKIENCQDCGCDLIFHKMDYPHPNIYCRNCNKTCKDCWNDPIDTDVASKLWRTINKSLY